ncbi:MAG: cytochrome b [Litorimonas sp.]
MQTQDRYSKVAMSLHWLIALIILGLIGSGLFMTNEGVPNRFVIYQWHKSFGVTVLILSFIRMFWRMGHKPPALPAGMKTWEVQASKLTHIGFYVLMIGVPLLGWAMISASRLPIETQLFYTLPWPDMPGVPKEKHVEDLLKTLHKLSGKFMLALIVLHIGAALKHQFISKDNLFARMVPFFKGH